MVRAEHQLADAHLGGQMPQRLGGEHERVVVQLTQVLRRLLLEPDTRVHLRVDAQGIVRARRVRRQVAAAVGRAELEPGEAIERSLEDQV